LHENRASETSTLHNNEKLFYIDIYNILNTIFIQQTNNLPPKILDNMAKSLISQ